MKSKNVHFFSAALAALMLFGCASGNKYSKISYGGAWAEAAKTNPKNEIKSEAKATETTVAAAVETEVILNKTNVELLPASKAEVSESNVSTPNQVAPATKAPSKIAQKVMNKVTKKLVKKESGNDIDNKLVLVIIAIFLPWLAVYLYEGEITLNFWLSLLLWFLFWIPGFIYALLVIFDVI